MTAETFDVQLTPLWSGRTTSEETEAKLESMAAEADRARTAAIAREAELLAASGTIPGSLADLQAVSPERGQASFARWLDRNAQLVEQVASGAASCCGEWRREGYYGWCSKLGRPVRFEEIGRDRENRPILNRCDGCPVAWRGERVGDWYSNLLVELEAICKGEIDV